MFAQMLVGNYHSMKLKENSVFIYKLETSKLEREKNYSWTPHA
jgi:hypothetical protein